MKANDPDAADNRREKLRAMRQVYRDVGQGLAYPVQGWGRAPYRCDTCGTVNSCPITTQAAATSAYCATCGVIRDQERVR